VTAAEIWLPRFLVENGMVDSSSDARRLLKQGAIKVNGDKLSEETITPGPETVIQVGKRKFLRLITG
jgi:tyrosyl-tRNA synthetase